MYNRTALVFQQPFNYTIKVITDKKRNYRSGSDKDEQVNMPLHSEISPLVEEMTTHLKNGDFTKAANLFMMGQTRGIFTGDHTLVKKLVKVIGKNATDRLVTAFAHYPCQFCKRGRLKCPNCEGHGYVDYETVCENWFGCGTL
jgi:hypothetical protein